jgi:hypothetical protein
MQNVKMPITETSITHMLILEILGGIKFTMECLCHNNNKQHGTVYFFTQCTFTIFCHKNGQSGLIAVGHKAGSSAINFVMLVLHFLS